MDHRSGDDVLVDTGTREVDPGPGDLPGGTTAGPPPARRGDWGAWVVLLAALVPLSVVVANSAALLTGALDDPYFLEYSSDANGVETTRVQEGVTFWARWSVLWWTFPPGSGLLAVSALVVLLAVLAHVGRPGWLAPGRVAHRVGAVLGAITAAAGASALAVALVAASRPVDQSGSDWYRSGSLLFDAGRLGVETFVAAALAALATVALLRTGTEDPVCAVEVGGAVDEQVERDGGGSARHPGTLLQPPVLPTVDPAVPHASADQTPAPVVVVSFPRPDDPSLYRRPSS